MSLRHDATYCLFALALMGTHLSLAQVTQSHPVTDSSAQASPLGPTLNAPATDTSTQASPIDAATRGGTGVAAHTTLVIELNEAVDSGSLKNGQVVHGKVMSATVASNAPAKQGGKAVVKPGTPVSISVIATVPAGKLNAVGEMSLELVKVGGQSVHTNTLTFRGKPGKRDVADSAPMVGTNAGLAAGASLTFVVEPQPAFSEPTPQPSKLTPGSVTGLASGSKPANFGQPTVSGAPGSNPGGGTMPPAQNNGQAIPAANQQAAPANATPTSTTQPH